MDTDPPSDVAQLRRCSDRYAALERKLSAPPRTSPEEARAAVTIPIQRPRATAGG